MKGKLYINSELVEAEINIPLSFTSNQLNDLNDKRTGMSGTVILEKNEIFHEDADIWDSEINCDYVMNGIKLVRGGKARLLKFTDKECHLKIYFGALLLSDLLKDIKINELVDDDLIIDWNLTTVQNSCDTNDVFFMFANGCVWGEDFFFYNNKVNAERFIPAIKVRKILELIEAETDIEFTGDFKTDTLIDKMCMPIITNKVEKDVWGGKSNLQSDTLIDFSSETTRDGSGLMTLQTNHNAIFTEVSGSSALSQNMIQIKERGTYDITAHGLFKFAVYHLKNNFYDDVAYQMTLQVILYKNNSIIGLQTTQIDDTTGFITHQFDFNITGFNVLAEVNDLIYVKFAYLIYADVSGSGQHILRLRGTSYTEVNSKNSLIRYGDTEINTLSLLPEMTALDFVKSLIQKKGFMLDFDFVNEKFILNYFNTLYKNILIADDWSNVFVDYEISDIYGVFGKNNIFKYSNDKDIEENYGGYTIEVDKETLPNETIILQDKTAGTMQEDFEEFSNDFEICRIPVKSREKKEWEKLNPRFLLFERKDVQQITITGANADANITEINHVWFKNAETGLNLDYEFLVKNFYSDYISMFDRYRKYIITAQLHSSDCIRDQLKPVYIKQLNAYFFVEKINYVSDTQLSTIELIRL